MADRVLTKCKSSKKKISYQFKRQGKRKKSIYLTSGRKQKNPLGSTPFIRAFSQVAKISDSEESLEEECSSGSRVSYKERRANLSESWRAMEGKLMAVELELFQPQSFLCSICNVEQQNIIRCLDCGPNSYFCQSCFTILHKNLWFHLPDIWKEDMFVKLNMETRTIKRVHHECNFYKRKLVAVDSKGFHHNVEVQFCSCESEPETLFRHRLWPCSIKCPRVAVSVEYLELLRVFSMEKQVSCEGFCNALNHRFDRSPGYQPKVKDLSRILLNEVMESYRHHMYKLKHPKKIISDKIADGTLCPACEGDQLCGEIVCLDANFGLVRRKAAGPQSIASHHDNLFFANQEEVDIFLAGHNEPKNIAECSNFQAGSDLRSKGKNAKLDIKGVFGACCKHEHPKIFMDLKHGERLGYAVWTLKHLLKERPNLKVYYDIACKLRRHLEVKGDSILHFIELAVPVFHGYGHNLACQMEYSPRGKSGFGLTEGETVERLWSYLRNCNKITKEMKPEHRTDFLTDSLLHYSEKVRMKLGITLQQKLFKAKDVKIKSEEVLSSMLACLPVPITREHLATLASTKEKTISKENEIFSWEEQYSIALYELLKEKTVLEGDFRGMHETSITNQAGVVAKLDKKLCLFEKRHHISQRWSPLEDAYVNALHSAVNKKRINLLLKIKKENIERVFCCSLIKKYPAGQSVANKIFGNIKKIVKNMKKMITTYNLWSDVPSFHEAILPSVTWSQAVSEDRFTDLGHLAKKRLIDAYDLIQRAEEEENFVKKEMHSTLKFYQKQSFILKNALHDDQHHDILPFVRVHLLKLEIHLQNLSSIFENYVPATVCTPLLNNIGFTVCDPIVAEEEDERCFQNVSFSDISDTESI